jgi:hypothetical protein
LALIRKLHEARPAWNKLLREDHKILAC